eukprot:gene10864-10945_t
MCRPGSAVNCIDPSKWRGGANGLFRVLGCNGGTKRRTFMSHSPATFDSAPVEPQSCAAERLLDTLAKAGRGSGLWAEARGRDPLRTALLQSRQRWRDTALMAADLVFETDRNGCFVFVTPDPALGWPASALIGQPAEMILAGSSFSQNFNPFRPTSAVRARRTWLRRPDGSSVCFSFATSPLLDEDGRIIGARGLGQDVSEQDGHDAAVATALRRGEMLDHILWRMRQEVLAPRMMQVALDSITTGMGLEGTAVIDMAGDGVLPTVLHQTGSGLNGVLCKALALLENRLNEPGQAQAPDGRVVLVCPCQTRFGDQAGLALWRGAGGRAMDADDVVLASSATGLIRVILEHEAIQREMARQARTDPLTGLLNRRALRVQGPKSLEHLATGSLPALTMSIGIATRWPGRGEDVEALVQRADHVMYQVKRSGRAVMITTHSDGTASDMTLTRQSERLRVRVASDSGADLLALTSLAQDPSITVRTALAINPAATGSLLRGIAADPDERVRAVLAHRLASMLPGLSRELLAPIQSDALAALSLLVADEAVRVRLAIVSVIKDMANVPHSLVLQLAGDAVFAVSDPIIRLSPMLTDDDLLSLVCAPNCAETLISVARRPFLCAQVADRLASTLDREVVVALLKNASAAISEGALDEIIAHAAEQPDWHGPLVQRPQLSASAARALAALVVDDALADLALRADLAPELSRAIAARVGPLLAGDVGEASIGRPKSPTLDEAVLQAQALAQAGQLDEAAAMEAARRGEVRMCLAMLSVSGCVPIGVVERASTLRSTKGLVSLIWRAGLTMRCAGMLQTLLLRLPPEAVLRPDADGGFPLTPEEMHWQVDFLIRIGTPPTTWQRNGAAEQIGRIGLRDPAERLRS